jgi:tetratricopeptide (TPR) repeat protein
MMFARSGMVLACLASLGLVLTTGVSRAQTRLEAAIDHLAGRNYEAAAGALEALEKEAPSEAAVFYLSSAYMQQQNLAKAIATLEKGAQQFPLSGRIYNALGMAYEEKFDVIQATRFYRKAFALDPVLISTTGGHYDPAFNAIYIPLVHDHRGANSCAGRLYVDDQKIHFVVYVVASGFGSGNDDSFETSFSNIDYVEVDRKQGEMAMDYSFITLLTNLSGPRRRIGSGEESRVDLKFVFKEPIKGYRGKPWTKPDIKFFFIEPEMGNRLLAFLEGKGVKTRNLK